MSFKAIHVIIFNIFFVQVCEPSLSDISSSVFGSVRNGIIAAFGDFNADKATDIFVLTDDGKSLVLLLAHTDLTDGHFTRKVLIPGKTADGTVITSVAPSDFDGDSQMDVLVTRKKEGTTSTDVTVEIYWGMSTSNALDVDNPFSLNETLRDQPIVVDANADMIPDLFGEISGGNRAFWLFNVSRSYTKQPIENGTVAKLPPLRVPQSSAFLDLNNDFTADLCVTSVDDDNKLQFEFWYNERGVLTWNKTIPAPVASGRTPGQPVFVDMNGDHSINIVLPACSDVTCSVHVWSNDKWYKLSIKFKSDDKTTWKFVSTIPGPISWLTLPLSLRTGDYNLNSYPDALAVLTSNVDGKKRYAAFILRNVGCGGDCEGYPQTFEIDFNSPLTGFSDRPIIAAFFDLLENGILDILVTTYNSNTSHSQMHALKQTFTEDACFMKVMVVSGLCMDNCPSHHKPYGVNQVGPVVKFQTVKSSGDLQIGIASQLSQSAYFSLQLPFILFGLGQTPNFVDSLEVGIPYPKGGTARHKEWTSIIPNSQLIIIPYPVDNPSSWKNQLFVTPSRLVLLTGAALLGTCGFIAGIVGILHWREKVEDKREKLQEAHKFHFDAM